MKKLELLVMPLIAMSLLACNKGGGEDKPPVGTFYNVKFNITDCSVTYEGNLVGDDGIDIEVPKDTDPYYVKFKVTSNTFKKPSSVMLDKVTDYTFDSKNGDLSINLKSDLNVIGICDIYKTLEECTWSQIAKASEAGEAECMFNVGEEKTVVLLQDGVEQGFAHTVRIIDFGHDKDPEGKDLGITFEFENVITEGTDTPVGAYETKWDEFNYDYRSSILNAALNDKTDAGSVINRLPEDLRDVIKPVDKKVGVNESRTHYDDYIALGFDGTEHPFPYLFALAHDEMTITKDDDVIENEGDIYAYYRDHPDLIIKSTVGGYGYDYWLRSPSPEVGSKDVWVIKCGGVGSFDKLQKVYYEHAIAPAFCI